MRVQSTLRGMVRADADSILLSNIMGLRVESGLSPVVTDGHRSLRGTARFLRFRDGWGVLNLARESDLELLHAFTQGHVMTDEADRLDRWAALSAKDEALRDAVDLGLAFAVLPVGPPMVQTPIRYAPSGVALKAGGVVNLSGLWAGPLAGRILADAGIEVTVLSAQNRPELPQPAWAGRFAKIMRHRQAELRVPRLSHPVAVEALERAQVIITSSRPDSLARAGIAPRPDQLWLQITAYGAEGMQARRIGYGDDVGVAAGGAIWGEDGAPRFQGDAFPDPLTGMLGALGVLRAQQSGQGGVVSVNLHDCAAWALGGQGEV